MAEISKITLPGGTTYDIKDATARSAIDKLNNFAASGVSYVGTTSTVLTDGNTTTTTIKKGTGADAADYTVQTGDMVSYNNIMFAWNGSQWDQLGTSGAFHALAYKDSVSGSLTPTGSVSKPSFSGSEGTISVSGTASGSVSAPTFTGTAGSVSVSGTPSGSVAVTAAAPGTNETANYTPTGSVSVTPNTTSIQQITGVGSNPSLGMSVANEILSITWSAGSTPTRAAVTVATGIKSASFTGSGTKIKASFTGNGLTSTGSFTPAGKCSAPTFTGKANTSTGKFTPSGSVSQPTFTGNAVTVTSK